MTLDATYRRQILIQNNFIASQALFPIHGIIKTVMRDKVYEELTKISGVYTVEETHLTKKKGKWLVITSEIKKYIN